MATKYNLSTGVADSFTFALADKAPGDEAPVVIEFSLRYPSQKDLEPSQGVIRQIADLRDEMRAPEATTAQKKEIQEQIDNLEREQTKFFYDLVTPVGHNRTIEEVLERANIMVVKNFNKMVKKEFTTD